LNKYIKCNFGGWQCGTSTIVDIRRLKVNCLSTSIIYTPFNKREVLTHVPLVLQDKEELFANSWNRRASLCISIHFSAAKDRRRITAAQNYGKALGFTNLAFPLSVLGRDEKYGGQGGQIFASAFGSLIANIIAKLISIANTLHAERDKLHGLVYLFCSKTN
jgi:hypothetical protein